jgi:hypothetical protein
VSAPAGPAVARSLAERRELLSSAGEAGPLSLIVDDAQWICCATPAWWTAAEPGTPVRP